MFDEPYRSGRILLEVVPQGNLAERIRAAGAGIGAFFCPTGVGTPLAEGEETRTIDGCAYVLEYPIRGDVALIRAHIGDGAGNPLYRKPPAFSPGDGHCDVTHDRRSVARRRRRAPSIRKLWSRRKSSLTAPRFVGRIGRPTHDGGGIVTPHVPSRTTVEHLDRGPLDRREPAAIIARDISARFVRQLGRGQPTTVAEYLPPEADVVLHTENGMLGMGGEAVGDEVDGDLTNAGKVPVTETAGALYFHHADSFAMMRGGHLDVCVLGAFQVSQPRRSGQLAHRCGRRHPRGRRSHGSRHRREERLRDDEPLRQGRHRQTGARSAPTRSPACRCVQPGLHRLTQSSRSTPPRTAGCACWRRSGSRFVRWPRECRCRCISEPLRYLASPG